MASMRNILAGVVFGGIVLAIAAYTLAPDSSPERGDIVGRAYVVDGDIVGRAYVVDGDSLEIAGRQLRLFGIDAPEGQQYCADKNDRPWPCGRQAASALRDLIKNKKIVCSVRDIDSYKRLVSRCKLGKTDINAWMVKNGHALAYRRYSQDYIAFENSAREHKRGMWRGKFIAPWRWRRQNR